eukprot:9656197-Heterocapsa_arctica.AAC.1
MARIALAATACSAAPGQSARHGHRDRPSYPSSSMPELATGLSQLLLRWPVPAQFRNQETALSQAAPGIGAS